MKWIVFFFIGMFLLSLVVILCKTISDYLRVELRRDADLERRIAEQRQIHERRLRYDRDLDAGRIHRQLEEFQLETRRIRLGGEQPLTSEEKRRAAEAVIRLLERRQAATNNQVAEPEEVEEVLPNDPKALVEHLIKKRQVDAESLVKKLVVQRSVAKHEFKEPYRTIYEGQFNKSPVEVREYPPCRRSIAVRIGKYREYSRDEIYTIWFPHTIFMRYWDKEKWRLCLAFAPKTIETDHDTVYQPFIPNVWGWGGVCTPVGSDMDRTVKQFWESLFITGEIADGLTALSHTFGAQEFDDNMLLWEACSLDDVLAKMKYGKTTLRQWAKLRNLKVTPPPTPVGT